MYYILDENHELYTFADYQYEADCQYTDIITQEQLDKDRRQVIVADVEVEIDVPDFDEEGNPIIIEYQDTEVVIDYDEEGNPIGSHEITVTKQKQQTHKETITVKGLVLNPDYPEIALEEAKTAKYKEANTKAFQYLESGEAVYTFEEGKSIEATDGNIAKLGLSLVNFILQQDYTSTIEWNTKENENVQLNAEALQGIVAGLQGIQAEVWTVKFPAYNAEIDAATTAEEVEAIEIDYANVGED